MNHLCKALQAYGPLPNGPSAQRSTVAGAMESWIFQPARGDFSGGFFTKGFGSIEKSCQVVAPNHFSNVRVTWTCNGPHAQWINTTSWQLGQKASLTQTSPGPGDMDAIGDITSSN